VSRVLARVVAATTAGALALVPVVAQASNDPRFDEQWNLDAVGAPAAWARSTGQGIRIGIVDTGIDLNHEDLAGKVVAHTNCIGAGGDPTRCKGSAQDDQGHGTHVSGIAAARKDNGKGIAGVAPDADLVVAKVLDATGSGTDADVTAGIKWVVDNGAQVVNLSLGDPAFVITSLFGTALAEGIVYAWSKGAVPVLASGNSNLLGLGIGSSDYGSLPAIVVGATDRQGRASGFSSPLGTAAWGLVAPGGAGNGRDADDVLSTVWKRNEANAYTALAGTSMAAPHVAGAVALLLSQGLSPTAAVARLLTTANPAISCGPNSPACRGQLDLARAVTGASTGLTPVPTGPGATNPGLNLGSLLDLVSVLPLPLGRSAAPTAAAGPEPTPALAPPTGEPSIATPSFAAPRAEAPATTAPAPAAPAPEAATPFPAAPAPVPSTGVLAPASPTSPASPSSPAVELAAAPTSTGSSAPVAWSVLATALLLAVVGETVVATRARADPPSSTPSP